MHLSFILALAAAFKLTVSPVSAVSICPIICETRVCCPGEVCTATIVDRGVSMVFFI